MKRIGYYAAAVTAVALMVMALRCTNMTASNTSEVGNPKLSGHLVDGRSASAAQGALVRVYPVYLNKMAQELGKTATGVPAIDSTLTDRNGYYSFDSLKKNVYSIEAKYIEGSDTLYLRHPSVLFIESQDLGYDTLRLPGWIRGKVVVPSGESPKNITCYIPGTSFLAITNDTGGFRITGIPAGTYSLSITGAKIHDTTLYDSKVTPNHETNTGYIVVGFDRGKNEHDVWGVFDTTYNCKAIDSIEAVVSGDSIPSDKPRIYRLDWRPSLNGYSGFIYVPDNGFFWKVDIWVFDTLGRRIGAYRVPTINRATGDVEVPNFNPFNSVPVITLHDTTVSINDTIRLHAAVSTLADDSIESMEWKIGNAGTFTKTTNRDTVIVAPNDSGNIHCIFRVTDIFRNTATCNALISVIIDPPNAVAGNDTVVSIKDTIRLHGVGSDLFGRIVKWEWDIGAKGHFVRTSTGDTAIIAPVVKDSLLFTCVLRVTDDDSNRTMDIVHIKVLQDAPVVNIGPDTSIRVSTSLTFMADVRQQYGTIVMHQWKYMGSESVWTDSGSTLAEKLVIFNSPGEKKVICQVRDDDGNVTADTVNILVVTEIGGILPMNTVLRESESPYAVKQELIVQTGGKLTIEPGTIVRIDPGIGMTINSTFNAEGTSLKKIIFCSNSLDSTSQWGPINCLSSECKMKFCEMMGGTLGGSTVAGAPDTVILDSCSFKHFNIYTGQASYGLLRGCIFLGSEVYIGGNKWNVEGNRFISVDINSPRNLELSATLLTISSNQMDGGGRMVINGNGVIVNNIIENSNGDGIISYGCLAIINNTISNCAGSGIFAQRVTWASSEEPAGKISNNILTGNGFGVAPSSPAYLNAGIVCIDAPYTIDSNIITNNNIGVICSSSDNLTNNNIYSNRDYDFRVLVNDAGNVTAPNNWWGMTDTAQIQKKIFDYNDDNGLGKVLLDPVAPAEIPGAGPR